MKKTLIALAVAASAAISGSAMAWEANGLGTPLKLGGTLTPADNVTPWEVMTGAPVTELNADIGKGQSVVNIELGKAIPVLGIRTQTNQPFQGVDGISPQVDYGGAIDVDGFSAGVTTLTLDVTDANGEKMGTMSAPFLAGAGVSRSGGSNDAYSAYVYSDYNASAFKGGLGTSAEQVLTDLTTVISRVGALDSGFTANFNQQDVPYVFPWRSTQFEHTGTQYSGFYGSGIEQGNVIRITLDQAASGDAPIQWKASLPVTVYYQ